MTFYKPQDNWIHLRLSVAVLSLFLSVMAFYTDDIINPDVIF